MKKIFTLFMMTLFAVCISASPMQSATEKKYQGHTSSTVRSTDDMLPLKEFSAKALRHATDRRLGISTNVKKSQSPVSKHKVSPAHKASSDVVELVYDDIVMLPKYYEQTGDWALILQCLDESKTAYGHILQLDWYGPEDNYTGTFTTEDFNMEYTHMMTTTSMGSIFFEEINMTISIEEVSENISKVILDATLEGGTDGFSTYPTYKVHAEQEIYVPKTTINITIPDAQINRDENGFTILAKNDDLDFTLMVKNPNYVADYYDNMDAYNFKNSSISYKGTKISPLALELDITIVETTAGLAYAIKINMLGDDIVEYVITATAAMPAPIDTVSITCTNLNVDDSYAMYLGGVTLDASNDEYELYGIWEGQYAEEGTYTGKQTDLSITNILTEEYVPAQLATFHVTLDEHERWAVEGTALGFDNIWYELHLNWEVPDVTETIVVSFETSAKAEFYPDYDNDFMLYNEDAHYYASINIAGIGLDEEFAEEDVNMMYSGFEIYDGEVWTPVQIASVRNGLLTQNGDTTKLQADFITFNGVAYEVHLWYVAPTPTQVVELNYPQAQFINNLNWGGCYNMMGYSPDSMTMMVVTIPAYYEEDIAGNFVNDGLFGQFGDGRYEIDGSASFYGIWNEEMEDYDRYFVQKGTVEVTMDQDGKIVLTGSLICDDAVQYDVTMVSQYEGAHLDYDAEEGAIDRTFTDADTVLIEDYTDVEGIIYMEALSMEAQDAFSLLFLVEESDPDIIIPEGTYEISDSWDYNTVLAGSGIGYDGELAPSFYATFDAEGYVEIPLYFLVKGTVVVTKNENGGLHMEITATNSYDVPVHIVYNASATGLENVATKDIIGVEKMLIDGQLVIIRNGQIFNATGAQL